MIDENKHYIPDDPRYAHLGGNTAGGNPRTFYPLLWNWMVSVLGIQSVLDVGCAEGHALREFARMGCLTTGIEGSQHNVDICRNAGLSAICWDFTNGPIPMWHSDLAWCCEVVGQIEEKYVQAITKTFLAARFVALTHQLPGQSGYHVVNGQTAEYWRGAMASAGFLFEEKLTEESKKYGHDYWTATGSIYRRI